MNAIIRNGNIKGVTATSEEIEDGTLGCCLGCGEEAWGVEPDARKYVCECCDKPKVYGLEELLMMGYVEIEEAEDE